MTIVQIEDIWECSLCWQGFDDETAIEICPHCNSGCISFKFPYCCQCGINRQGGVE